MTDLVRILQSNDPLITGLFPVYQSIASFGVIQDNVNYPEGDSTGYYVANNQLTMSGKLGIDKDQVDLGGLTPLYAFDNDIIKHESETEYPWFITMCSVEGAEEKAVVGSVYLSPANEDGVLVLSFAPITGVDYSPDEDQLLYVFLNSVHFMTTPIS